MALWDESQPECTKPQLCHGAIVQDLSADVHVLHIVLDKGFWLSCDDQIRQSCNHLSITRIIL